jgi:hypothetical protein
MDPDNVMLVDEVLSDCTLIRTHNIRIRCHTQRIEFVLEPSRDSIERTCWCVLQRPYYSAYIKLTFRPAYRFFILLFSGHNDEGYVSEPVKQPGDIQDALLRAIGGSERPMRGNEQNLWPVLNVI